jgi:hypothetical protein
MVERNPKYDGLDIFTIDVGRLRPGDVLLTRNVETTSLKGKLQSGAIMKATRGNFSHALICTVPPTFIEAVGHGVSNLSAQICFAHDLTNVRLLRYHDASIAKNAGSEALPLLGQKYSIRRAVRSILPSAKLSDVPDGELFCSALVAAAFRKAGAEEFKQLDPMKVTPATLEKATYFTDVTPAVFQRILSPSNIEEMSALDGDRVASPLGLQAELFQEFCSILLPMIRTFVGNTPELTFAKIPATFLECIMFIGAASNASTKLPEVIAGPIRKNISEIDDIAFGLLDDGRYAEMQKAATALDDESVQNTIRQSFLSDPDIDLDQTRALIVATRQQISSRSGIFAYRERMESCRTTKKWLAINIEVIEVLKRRLAGLEESFQRVFPGKRIDEAP